MKAKVDKEICIGCEACVNEVPEIFKIDEDGLATASDVELEGKILEKSTEAKDNCPVEAISIS